MLNTQNNRRAAGCHPCLSVAALPNVGLPEADRPQLAWSYPEIAFLRALWSSCDMLIVIEALVPLGAGLLTPPLLLEESMQATVLVLEKLSATDTVIETFSATATVVGKLSATALETESLAATAAIIIC